MMHFCTSILDFAQQEGLFLSLLWVGDLYFVAEVYGTIEESLI